MVDPHGDIQPFRDEEEKLRFLLKSQYIQLVTPLPCNTEECLNMASVASADFDMAEKVWVVVPLCKECARKMREMYREEI